MGNIKPRASRVEIFSRLQRLNGPEAEIVVKQMAGLLDKGAAQDAINRLVEFDSQMGGYCPIPDVFCKPSGAYRPLGYIAGILLHPYPREMARYLVDTIGQHLENLLQRIALLGFLNGISNKLFPMGSLVVSMKMRLPQQLYEDLQWFASEVYNHAKHSVDVFERQTPEEKAHYFQLEEALALVLIGRKLAVALE